MVIGIDAGALSVSDDRLKVGVWRVTKQALLHLASIDAKNNYRFYAFAPIERGIVEAFGGRAQMVQLPKPGWHKVWLPLELKKRPVDVFLGFAQALPFSKTSYNIGFVYDLGFLYHAEVYGTSAITLNKQTDSLVRRTDHIITISHATKSDLTREYKIPAEKITVAYPGVDAAFSPAGEKYVGPKPYFLFVGSLNKVKDIPTLLESFAKLRGYDLYLVGGNYWPDPAIEETIKKFHLAGRVKMLGFVPDEELPKYYRGATAFVTTALQEGFCLPAAEAMACGTPVVSLPQGALGEIVGKGGIIISQKFPRSGIPLRGTKVKSQKSNFTEGMEKMTDNKIRAVYAKKAIVQAKKYRWETFATHILECITSHTVSLRAKRSNL